MHFHFLKPLFGTLFNLISAKPPRTSGQHVYIFTFYSTTLYVLQKPMQTNLYEAQYYVCSGACPTCFISCIRTITQSTDTNIAILWRKLIVLNNTLHCWYSFCFYFSCTFSKVQLCLTYSDMMFSNGLVNFCALGVWWVTRTTKHHVHYGKAAIHSSISKYRGTKYNNIFILPFGHAWWKSTVGKLLMYTSCWNKALCAWININ